MGARFRLQAPLAVLCAVVAVAGAGLAAAPRAGAQPRASAASWRTFTAVLHPAGGDLAVLAIGFPHAGKRRLTAGGLRVSVAGAFGGDYLAVALPRRLSAHGWPALVLLANRVTPLMDPARVHLRVRAEAALGPPLLRVRTDPFSLPAAAPPHGLCSLSAGGRPLTGTALRALFTRGAPLSGLGAADAAADAYDAACGLRYPQALVRAIRGGSAPCPAGTGCVSHSEPVPPAPPEAPRCTPCDPRPGHACPLQRASAAVCVAASGEDRPAASTGSH